MLNSKSLIKIVCLTIIAIPNVVAGVSGFALPPWAMVLLGVLGLAAGYTLGELDPGYRPSEQPPHG